MHLGEEQVLPGRRHGFQRADPVYEAVDLHHVLGCRREGEFRVGDEFFDELDGQIGALDAGENLRRLAREMGARQRSIK